MPRICIVSATIVAAALLMSGALAQAATGDATEKPVVLAGLKPPHELKSASKVMSHKRIAATRVKKHVRVATGHASKPQIQTDAARADVPRADGPRAWPVPPVIAPADTASAAPPAVAPPEKLPDPNEVVVGGQTVQVTSPEQVNAIDLAANDETDEPPTAAPADRADTDPAPQTVLAAPAHVETSASTVGSASWIAQVMAALGGAAAAGVVAWFLIGSGPVRIYS